MKIPNAKIGIANVPKDSQLYKNKTRRLTFICLVLVSNIAAFVVLLFGSNAAFAEWEKVYPIVMTVWEPSGNQKYFGGAYDLYADKATKQSIGANPAMWHMRDYRTMQKIDDTYSISRSSKYEYDCEKRLGRNLALRSYNGQMATGHAVVSYDVVGEWETVRSGSMLEITWEIACERDRSSSEVFWFFNANDENASISISTLTGEDGATFSVKPDHIKNLRAVLNSIRIQSGIDAPFLLMAKDDPNAYSARYFNQRFIGMTLPMLNAIGSDHSALATTLAHEFAHLYLNHDGKDEIENSTNSEPKSLWDKLVSVVIAPVRVLMNVSAFYMDSAFSRDQERDADKLGLDWAIGAGFSPCGVVTTMTAMRSIDDQISVPFLSSHPSYAERIDKANQAAMRINGKSC